MIRVISAPNRSANSRIEKDRDGFITAVTRRRHNAVGVGKRTAYNGPIKGAVKTVDLYIGRLDADAEKDDLLNYVTNDFNITPIACTELKTRIPFSMAFKLTVKLSDQINLLNSEYWPEGVICRRYCSSRN